MPIVAHEGQFVEAVSTVEKPYHYVGSGLSNVYLVGVKYELSPEGEQCAEIPCLPALLKAIAEAVVEKKAPLTGEEVRFLRKRMRLTSKAFAETLGSNVQHFSRIENGLRIQPQMDLLIRLFYAAYTELPSAVSHELVSGGWHAGFDRKQNIIASKDESHNWLVTFDKAA